MTPTLLVVTKMVFYPRFLDMPQLSHQQNKKKVRNVVFSQRMDMNEPMVVEALALPGRSIAALLQKLRMIIHLDEVV
jgi:hypothetical protein